MGQMIGSAGCNTKRMAMDKASQDYASHGGASRAEVARTRARFLALVDEAIDQKRLRRLLLSRPSHRMVAPGIGDEGPVLQKVLIKPVRVREGVRLDISWQYDTRNQNECLPFDEARARIAQLLDGQMQAALLDGGTVEAELGYSKRGRPLFRSRKLKRDVPDTAGQEKGQPAVPKQQSDKDSFAHRDFVVESVKQTAMAASSEENDWMGVTDHNRARQYLIAIDRPWLKDLGVVSPKGVVVPSMARKWRQINRFVEILASAWQKNPAFEKLGRVGQPPVRIQDFGAGKGYLTFALHDHLSHTLGLQVETVGIERRTDLVTLCNRIARKNGMHGLRFEQGDILERRAAVSGLALRPASGAGAEALRTVRNAGFSSDSADIVIALHACDTATDDALYRGIDGKAAMLVCSPCCHKELRPQLLSPSPLQPILRHGIHLGQEAEMLTDGLRALLLEAEGYEAQVFEFISLEHTSKNKMILASRSEHPRPADEVLAEIDRIKQFYGIRTQHLDALLHADRAGVA